MTGSLGVFGAGPVGRAVARHAVRAGMPTVLSSRRGPDAVAPAAAETGARAGTVEDAAGCELLLLAIPFIGVAELGERLPSWSGRIVIDATNQFATARPYAGRFPLGEETGSEYVARHLPGARVVKAFNGIDSAYLTPEPRREAGCQIVFLAGDDVAANTAVAEFVAALGFAPVPLGGLRDGGRLVQLDGPLSGLAALRQN